jgi:hypothetical protein
MSQPRPPYEPTHLPRRDTGFSSIGDTAQIQRPPSFPSAGFLAHSDQRPVPGTQLPPLFELPTKQRGVGGSARHVQLPPMEPFPTVNDQAGYQGGRSIPVSHLLSSDNPPSSKRMSYGASSSGLVPPAAYRSPELRSSPNDLPRRQQYFNRPTVQHHLDNPLQRTRHIQPQQLGPPGPTAPHALQHYANPVAGPRNEPAYNLTPTSYSTPSCYDPQTELSLTSAAPPTTTTNTFRRMSKPPQLDYTLIIRQQPAAARACGFGEKDRRVIDPPPILELKITDKRTGGPEQDLTGILALHCTLLNPANQEDETQALVNNTDMQSTRRLMGTLVTSTYQAKDERGIAGSFFVFPDLSCRAPGRYRLHMKLLRIDLFNMQRGAIHDTVASVITDVFSVFIAKDFPGMRASSALLKALRRQGLNVGVKKGSEARRGKERVKKEDTSSSDGDDSGGSTVDTGGPRMIESGLALSAKISRNTGLAGKKRRRNS